MPLMEDWLRSICMMLWSRAPWALSCWCEDMLLVEDRVL